VGQGVEGVGVTRGSHHFLALASSAGADAFLQILAVLVRLDGLVEEVILGLLQLGLLLGLLG
jgi:hypothetical protein